MKTYLTLFTLLLALPSQAGTTATLVLKGTVAQILDVSVSPEPISVILPLEQSQSNLKVATVNEKSNNPSGYSIQITSQNQGKLKRTTGDEVFPYSMFYNGSSVNLTNGQTFNHNFTNPGTKQREVRISYTGNDNLVAGEYVDTVTFTIIGN